MECPVTNTSVLVLLPFYSMNLTLRPDSHFFLQENLDDSSRLGHGDVLFVTSYNERGVEVGGR